MKLFKKVVAVAIIGIMLAGIVAGCNKNNKVPVVTPDGIGSGSVDLTGDKPEIALSDIVAVVGTDIDYTSKLEIKNEQDFPDLEIWVNASTVDIYTPGQYTAQYTFYWGDNQTSATINVTIVEESETQSGENSGEDTKPTDSEANSQETTKKPVSEDYSTTKKSDVNDDTTKDEKDTTETTTTIKNQVNTDDTTTKKEQTTIEKQTTSKVQPTTTKPTTTKPTTTKPTTTKPTTTKPTTTKPTTTKPTTTKEEPTTTRKFIPSTSESKTTVTDLGYMYVELLSGSTVRVKVTSARYIVSTRTDVSIVTKKGYKYEVSKLIITFNTGTEQVLETVEKRIG